MGTCKHPFNILGFCPNFARLQSTNRQQASYPNHGVDSCPTVSSSGLPVTTPLRHTNAISPVCIPLHGLPTAAIISLLSIITNMQSPTHTSNLSSYKDQALDRYLMQASSLVMPRYLMQASSLVMPRYLMQASSLVMPSCRHLPCFSGQQLHLWSAEVSHVATRLNNMTLNGSPSRRKSFSSTQARSVFVCYH